jgi:heme-degrading monooxygenase HmoA
MFIAIFEVHPKKGRFNDYLALAKQLKPSLERIDGFVDNERFESKGRPGWILSLSTWRDEKSMVRWRTTGVHHMIQKQGRAEIFEDYHLRIGEVITDTNASPEAPINEQRFDETEIGARFATVTELTPRNDASCSLQIVTDLIPTDPYSGMIDHEVFASIYNPGKIALLVLWENAKSVGWNPGHAPGIEKLRHRQVRIVRDYGIFDRREAPQFFSDAKGRNET